MYNEQIESLIEAALADGVLTEKEKQILFKKAQSMGIDLDEFEMVLDARLVKMKKEEEEKAATSAPKSNKFGDVKKCPSCGAMVQSFQGACPECGYAFEGIEANLSSKKLADKIDELMKEETSRTDSAMRGILGASGFGRIQADAVSENIKKRIQETIRNFPIPNSKADLMEFIISTKLKSKSGDYAAAYFEKYTECIEKARMLFPNDKDLAPLVADFSDKGKFKRTWASMSKSKKTLILSVLFLIIFFIIVGVLVSVNE